MSTTRIQRLNDEKAEALRQIALIATQIDATPDDQLDPLVTRSDEFRAVVQAKTDLIAKLEGASAAGDEARRQIDQLTAPQYNAATNPAPTAAPMTWGEQFVRSATFKDLVSRCVTPGGVTSGSIGNSAPVTLSGGSIPQDTATRAIIGSGGALQTTGGFVLPQRVEPFLFPLPPTDILDLIPVLPTNSNAVSFVQFDGFVNAATTVPETTQASRNNATNGVKPESSLNIALKQANVDVVGHILAASRQILADVPQFQSYVDLYGEGGVRLALAAAVVKGSGQIQGLTQNAEVQTQAFDTDMITSVRKAITKAYVVGLTLPTAVVMHPSDLERLDLMKDGILRYYFGGPQARGDAPLWNLAVRQSFDATPGQVIVGDYARGCALYKRQDTTLYVTDSHLDWFARNLIALLFEARYAFAIRAPKSFVKTAVVGP